VTGESPSLSERLWPLSSLLSLVACVRPSPELVLLGSVKIDWSSAKTEGFSGAKTKKFLVHCSLSG
jgi:hypothetical protein